MAVFIIGLRVRDELDRHQSRIEVRAFRVLTIMCNADKPRCHNTIPGRLLLNSSSMAVDHMEAT